MSYEVRLASEAENDLRGIQNRQDVSCFLLGCLFDIFYKNDIRPGKMGTEAVEYFQNLAYQVCRKKGIPYPVSFPGGEKQEVNIDKCFTAAYNKSVFV